MMLRNDIRYIIKRVIAAILIALILMFIKTHHVYAKEMTSTNWTYQYTGINTNSSAAQFTITGNPWANWRLGKLYFTVAVNKTAGSSTDPVLNIRAIHAISDNSVYTCTFGAVSNGNSTWQSQTYSVICPMDLGWPGVTGVHVLFNPIPQQTYSGYVVTLDGVATFEQDDSVNVNVDTSGTTSAINNQITNDNTNTTNIINNQNQNTQQQIESQKVCTRYDNTYVKTDNYFLTSNGTAQGNSSYGLSDFIKINPQQQFIIARGLGDSSAYSCFLNANKATISCFSLNRTGDNAIIPIPDNAVYVRLSFHKVQNKPIYDICKNGNQAIADGQQQINDTLNNDDVTGATSDAESFFDNFQSDSHGLSGIITAPLRLIQSLSSSSCSPLSIPLPFVHENATLPCMSTIYSTHFPTFLSLYQLITTGLIGYWVLIKLFGHVKGMQDPTDDRIEVLEL